MTAVDTVVLQFACVIEANAIVVKFSQSLSLIGLCSTHFVVVGCTGSPSGRQERGSFGKRDGLRSDSFLNSTMP
jgi:hypothetical protein